MGQFVAFWMSYSVGVTEPLDENDDLDFYVVYVKREKRYGQLIIHKSK